jgi:hypothetical protein
LRPVRLPGSEPKRPKYGAKRVVLDGYRFDSQRECRRYAELKIQAARGEIRELRVHPEFPLRVLDTEMKRSIVIGKYEADFMYLDHHGFVVVEDVKVKATRTPIYRWKAKHMFAQYGIRIVEV